MIPTVAAQKELSEISSFFSANSIYLKQETHQYIKVDTGQKTPYGKARAKKQTVERTPHLKE